MHPFLFHGISSYVVFLVLAFSAGYLDALRRARNENVASKSVERAYLALLFGALAGARLFHVLLESPEYYASAPDQVIAFWQGGFSIWGGAAGAIAALAATRSFYGTSLREILDVFAPSMLLGIAIGRIGCLLAGCCFGLPTGMPWGIAFDDPATFVDFPEVPLHPTQLYEAMGALLLSMGTRWVSGPPGRRFATALAGYSVLRFAGEFYRGDVARGWIVPDVFSLPQLCCVVAFGAAIAMASTVKSPRNSSRKMRGPLGTSG